MKKITLSFALALTLMLFTSSFTYAQFQYVGGFIYSATYPPSVSVVDPMTVWVAGGYQTAIVYRSTNGGVNWTLVTGNLAIDQFCIWGVDANTAWVGDGGAAGGTGGNAKVSKTTNAGVSWTTVLTTGGSAGFINGIVFSRTNPQIGVIESDPPSGAGQSYWVEVTTNGGTTWTLQQPPGVSGAASAQNSVFCIDASFYGYGLNYGTPRVTITSNGGSSWYTSALTGQSYLFVSGVAFNTDKMHGIGSTAQDLPNVSLTSNGGSSFTGPVNVGTGMTGSTLSAVKWIPGTNIIYVVGMTTTANSCKRSLDGGTTWTTVTTGGISGISHLDAFKASDNVIHVFAVAGDGSCIRYRDSVLITGINNNNSNIPVEYSLNQNYPNPFNPTTTIEYALPKSSNVTLKVYDMLGNEVRTVVNEYKTAGNYKVNFDASTLSSGVYFYRIVAGDFTDAKKMTLVK
jgi:hypothetical protein